MNTTATNSTATVSAQINELKEHAKKHGLTVRFRDHKTDQGDFCIFIYDPNFRKSYAVGYDGDWQSKAVSFEKCLKSAYNWTERRDKRFTFRDGRWQYGRYHFIIWKDGQSSDKDFYLSIEDADKAAADYLAQGYAVACYNVSPEEKSRPAKFYGDIQRHANDFVKRQAARLTA